MTRYIATLFTVIHLILLSHAAIGQTGSELDKAVATLRNISGEKLSAKQQEERAKQIDETWKLLIAKGAPAAERLRQEIEKVDRNKEQDDFFKLNASVVLWEIGKVGEADHIAKIWTSTPVAAQYNYVFYTAFAAAQTKDPRVLPMLRAILRDDKGSIFVGLHSMTVAWPLSHEFIWGSYGPAGLPVLAEILEKSNDEVELRSAMKLLSRAQYLPSLPRIRKLAADDRVRVRSEAIQSLGIYGHPDDYDRLLVGLTSNDPLELFSSAFALYEFEDERAVKHLIPLLQKPGDGVKVEASLALLHLLTPEAFAAVKSFVSKTTNPEIKQYLTRSLTLREEKLPKDFSSLSRDQQAIALDKYRDAELIPSPADPKISNQQLRQALAVWKEKGRIYDSGSDWIGEARVIAAAKPEDLELILEAQSAFYRRLSDECLYEVRDLGKAIKYIGRSRYRKGLGVSAKAELK